MLFYKSAKQSVRHFGVFMVKKRYEGPEKGRKLAMSGIPVSPPEIKQRRQAFFIFVTRDEEPVKGSERQLVKTSVCVV